MGFHLRRLLEKDASLMLEWMHDENVVSSLGTDFRKKTLKDALSFIRWSLEPECGEVHLACVSDDDEYLGTVSLKHIDQKNKNAEYAICFRRCAHGTGAASYATEQILRIAFEDQKLEKVYLYLYSINTRAERFYQKQNFKFEGRQRKQAIYKGGFVDVIWYGIVKEDWSINSSNNYSIPQGQNKGEGL